eukprot:TRINITY_DN16448_c0_g1_i1.p1 TRINITY_DN16448_c0_g1~~TRINITY_DN16448_c0_g1_i1.p1  ORF type:complete len:279 (-),score=77.88 TRINITY_DN16448_c0_g1_i1:488-1324(-)
MVRLTADLIFRSPQYFNPVKEREIDLRGNKIAAIENLGATEDHFDSIDLSDNEIVKLEGFPFLRRLKTLLVSNNRIARISPNIGASLPNLQMLVLTSNRIVNLADLESLGSLAGCLQYLSLLDNLVTKKPNYRLYVIHKLPKLRLLDFKKVKQKERDEAKKLFGSTEAAATAPTVPKKAPALTFVPGETEGQMEDEQAAQPAEEPAKKAPTPEQLTALKAAIANAQTLEEVARLEKALQSGQMPSALKVVEGSGVAGGLEPKIANGGGSKQSDPMEEG